uniref:WD domain, G-beta repeat-containing protein n=1 Tax=Macrostomum lignano TaxID=282301 RepID=A0A1I8FI83_9PLAT
ISCLRLPLGARPPLLATPQLLCLRRGEPPVWSISDSEPNPVVLFAKAEVLAGQRSHANCCGLDIREQAPPSCAYLADRTGDRLFELLEHSDACPELVCRQSASAGFRPRGAHRHRDGPGCFPLLPLLLKNLRYRRLTRPVIATRFPDTRLLLQRLPRPAARPTGRLRLRRFRPSISVVEFAAAGSPELGPLLSGWLEAKLSRIAAGLARCFKTPTTRRRQQTIMKRAIILACSLLADYLPWQLTESLASRVGHRSGRRRPVDEETASASAAAKVDDSAKRSRREKQEPLENLCPATGAASACESSRDTQAGSAQRGRHAIYH